jgi:hypothetical protein
MFESLTGADLAAALAAGDPAALPGPAAPGPVDPADPADPAGAGTSGRRVRVWVGWWIGWRLATG